MSWARPTVLTCDVADCPRHYFGWPWALGYEPRANGDYSCASVKRTRAGAATEIGWTTRRLEFEGVPYTADFCPEHSDDNAQA